MASLLLSSPNLSSPFLGKKHCVRGYTEKLELLKIHRTPRCAALDASYGGISKLLYRRFREKTIHTPLLKLRLHLRHISTSGHHLQSDDFHHRTFGNVSKFPRISVWNPYKRLGITPDASEEEIWSSRNFLLQQYAGHERSEESIEAAFERILMDSYWKRKKTKINLKSRLKKQVEESPHWVKNLLNFVELPPTEVIFRRLFLFAFMAGWSIMNSAEGGPAFQVAVSLAACIYFLNEKTKSLARASIIGLGSLVIGWVCGSVLVPMIPATLLQPTWTLELLTSLVAYVFLFLGCTFLK